jgi:hypothetical protein
VKPVRRELWIDGSEPEEKRNNIGVHGLRDNHSTVLRGANHSKKIKPVHAILFICFLVFHLPYYQRTSFPPLLNQLRIIACVIACIRARITVTVKKS